MIGLADAMEQGLSESAAALTASLRRSAIQSGWTPTEAAGLAVSASADGLSVTMSGLAERREYGTSSEPPSPAVRRWTADTGNIQAILLQFVDRRVQEVES